MAVRVYSAAENATTNYLAEDILKESIFSDAKIDQILKRSKIYI